MRLHLTLFGLAAFAVAAPVPALSRDALAARLPQ